MMNTKTPPSARKRSLSPRQLAANRANARKSTGPRTTAGKTRSRQNSLKHGLRVSADYAMIPEECPDTFAIFRQELRDALQPSNVLQLSIFPQIVNLAWRLQRCPEAQAKIFELEHAQVSDSPASSVRCVRLMIRCLYGTLVRNDNGGAYQRRGAQIVQPRAGRCQEGQAG